MSPHGVSAHGVRRAALLRDLAERVTALLARRPRVLVALDGPDAAGKTTLADDLADRLGGVGVRLSADDFHAPARERRARGPGPEAYLDGAFDVAALAGALRSFAQGDTRVVVGVHDLRSDVTRTTRAQVPPTCALVVDGVFLQRPELRDHWDLTIYLHVPELVTLERARSRDGELFGDADRAEARYRQRYLPAQALYRARDEPLRRADVVLDMTDPRRPRPLAAAAGAPSERSGEP